MNPLPAPERRTSLRFDKVFPVLLESHDYGEISAVARNISQTGMLVETPAPLPLGSVLYVHFCMPGEPAHLLAVGEVKNQYALNYCDEAGEFRSARGMGIRFLAFLDETVDRVRTTRTETLH